MRFYGVHPWDVLSPDAAAGIDSLPARLAAEPSAGVGEAGLDRLRSRTVSDAQRILFARQLAIAAEYRRPVVLHGAKCWGETLKRCVQHKGAIPAFLFHGFSRSEGLLPQIFALNGFVSVGPAAANVHAVNYRRMVAELPPDMILVESDMDDDADPAARRETLASIYSALAELRGTSAAGLAETVRRNALRFASFRSAS